MNLILCNNCDSLDFHPLFIKKSSKGKDFLVVQCNVCGLVQVNPQPDFLEVSQYYSDDYFTKRTDRGYDNYYSEKIKNEVSRVFRLNLDDLGFFEWEKSLPPNPKTMDIGCAAGYFVDYMKSRNWDAMGIEIASGPVKYGREVVNVSIIQSDFLEWDVNAETKFDLVTLWASIEHLHKPKETLIKIRKHLRPGGRLILSTCRWGVLSENMGIDWRFLNVPEHLYYYSLEGIIDQCKKIGYKKVSHITYGSGLTAKKDADFVYQWLKTTADSLVKYFDQGDMMALMFEQPE